MDTVKSYVFLVLTQGTCVLVHWTLNVVSDIESLHLILYIKIGLIGTYKSGWFLKISCTLLHISLLESYDTRARIHLDPLGSTQTCGAMSKLSHQTLSQCLRFLASARFLAGKRRQKHDDADAIRSVRGPRHFLHARHERQRWDLLQASLWSWSS